MDAAKLSPCLEHQGLRWTRLTTGAIGLEKVLPRAWPSDCWLYVGGRLRWSSTKLLVDLRCRIVFLEPPAKCQAGIFRRRGNDFKSISCSGPGTSKPSIPPNVCWHSQTGERWQNVTEFIVIFRTPNKVALLRLRTPQTRDLLCPVQTYLAGKYPGFTSSHFCLLHSAWTRQKTAVASFVSFFFTVPKCSSKKNYYLDEQRIILSLDNSFENLGNFFLVNIYSLYLVDHILCKLISGSMTKI